MDINSYTLSMREFISEQFQNRFLWAPFLMAFGAALYFTLNGEPPLPCPVLFAIAMLAGAFAPRVPTLLRGILLLGFGFCYAAAFTHVIDTPQITRNLRDLEISGTITKIDYTDTKTRIYIRIPANLINRDISENRTATVRVSMSEIPTPVHIGDTIDARVTLFRPASSYMPETFDYARWAYFNGLSATGFVQDYSITSTRTYNINTLRDYIHGKSDSFLADTLVLGYKSALPDDDRTIWTTNGVGHVWSISGFHMTLVSGWLFAFFYLIFRTIAPITRRVPARIPAMICAWFGLLFYLFISGGGIATIRAFLMTSLVFAAFVSGREALSMRNICLAFCLIFLINPHYVMQPGFQLSFSAVFGLIWYFRNSTYQKRTVIQRIRRAIAAAAMTSIIATIFTTPFVAAHFYQFPTYSLVGNLILLPLFSVAIIPLVMLGTVTATLGWTGPLMLAEMIYHGALAVATKIAALPLAVILTPHIPNIAIVFMIVGFLCLMFIRATRPKINYILCASFIGIGVVITALAPRPIFFATHDHELIAFVAPDGKLEFNKARASNHFFAFDTWKQINTEPTATPNRRRKCVRGVCIFETQNWTLAYTQKFVPTMNNIAKFCRDESIDYIVSYFDIDAPGCNHKILRGAFSIYKSGRVKYHVTRRPWHNPRR